MTKNFNTQISIQTSASLKIFNSELKVNFKYSKLLDHWTEVLIAFVTVLTLILKQFHI